MEDLVGLKPWVNGHRINWNTRVTALPFYLTTNNVGTAKCALPSKAAMSRCLPKARLGAAQRVWSENEPQAGVARLGSSGVWAEFSEEYDQTELVWSVLRSSASWNFGLNGNPTTKPTEQLNNLRNRKAANHQVVCCQDGMCAAVGGWGSEK